MTYEPVVNMNSLALVRDELEATMQRAAGEFEAYLLDPANTEALANCCTDLVQIAGTLRLIEFGGAALLADEMRNAAADIGSAGGAAAEALSGTLSHAFFALPRYIEMVATRHVGHPMLVIPYANELRVARRQPLIAEHHFYQGELAATMRRPLPEPPAAARPVELARLRQMYQVGLLGILRVQNPNLNLRLVARASQRFAQLLPAASGKGIWWLAAAVAERLANGGLALNLNRRRTLGSVERLMARYIKAGEASIAVGDEALARELVFLLAISGDRPGIAADVVKAFGIEPIRPDDRELARQREAMRGPGLEAIDSVVRVLKEELRQAKDILELASQMQGISAEEVQPLKTLLQRVADTLRVLNLGGASDILGNQLSRIDSWSSQPESVAGDQFLAMADALLFIESSLASLYRVDTNGGEMGEITETARRRMVADSQLSEASAIVIEESQAGISMAKRAIGSYLESGFDPVHIGNVSTTLDGVRGAMAILGEQRPASLLRGCVAFIDASARQHDYSPPQRQQLLETLADALISLEYYLNEMAEGRSPSAKILDVADESLAALGVVR